MAIQTAMAAIPSDPSKAVHNLIQQLDRAAVDNNKEFAGDSDQNDQAALLLESLGIHLWLNIQHTHSTKGEEATLNLIRQLHEDLPNILEAETIEDGKAEKLAGIIARVLSWVDLQKNTKSSSDTEPNVEPCADISSQLKANPLIDFNFFSEDEKANVEEGIDNLNSSAAEEVASMNGDGDPFIPTDTPRTVEYRVSEKHRMMWKCCNMNNLAPITLDMWAKFVNLSEGEISACRNNAINGNIPAKVIAMKDTLKMALFRDKYSCTETVSVRIKVNVVTDSNRLPKHKALLWNWMRPYLRCNWEAQAVVMAQYAFMHARQLMIETTMEVFADPTKGTLPEHGEANGVGLIERLIKPAVFSDTLISNQIHNAGRKRTRQNNSINLNSAPTRIVPMGRGQRMRGGRQFQGYRPNFHSPGSSSSSSRSLSSAISGYSPARDGTDFRSSPLGRRNMSHEFRN
ncbi:hypothetical protein R1sor_013646 [Riccia sorocarpa]|uniref:Uncharacterized protein n=1 Tax=Riccia sorocarpa TaxID=122646 RepID=A0ABD3H9T8_9MARC